MTEIIVLRVVHVLGAILWVGSAVFNAALLMPVLSRLGPGAGPVMNGLKQRGLLVFMPTVAVLTILSGLRLMWITSNGFSEAYFATAYGRMYAASGSIAIVTFVLGLLVSRPIMTRMGALTAQLTDAADDATRATLFGQLAAARRATTGLSWVFGGLLVTSAAGMAVARYLG